MLSLTDELDVAVEEQAGGGRVVAVVELPRGSGCEARIGRLVRRVLEPVVLDHAGLERWVAGARDRRAAVGGLEGARRVVELRGVGDVTIG